MSVFINRFGIRVLNHYRLQGSIFFLSSEVPNPPSVKKKKKPPEVRINVIENSSLTVMSKESALKLASRRGLSLTEVENPAHWMTAGNRPPFELLSQSQKVGVSKDDSAKKKGFRGTKTAVLGSGIQEHDIATKIKQVKKWLGSGFVTEVAIDTTEKTDSILERLQEAVKDVAKLPGQFKKKNKNIVRIEYEPLKTRTNEEEETK